MTTAYRTSRWLALLLLALLLIGTATRVTAAESAPPPAVTARPVALMGSFMQNVVGNRQRMIQFAFVGFGIGVLILVTATRKH
jgi:hypothetical protein